MRPEKLEDFVGQEHLLGPGKSLRQAVVSGRPGSMILWGPPGCGKTTLARLIAVYTGAFFVEFSAVTSGIPELRKVIEAAEVRVRTEGGQTILFVDEIHRFNKAQQDAFLPHIESGLITLVGATTEKPYFSLNPPLLSRARVYRLRALTGAQMLSIIDGALQKDELMQAGRVRVDEDAALLLVSRAEGDARLLLDALEMTVLTAPATEESLRVTRAMVEEVLQQKALKYGPDEHYDVISAYIKSMRGSDPDAAVYWLARMLSAGEDPRFIARRLVIQAAEDVGIADPMALILAEAAARVVADIGMPEAAIPLAEATIYVACAPKSNAAYLAIKRAMEAVENFPAMPVPDHIKAQPAGYKYPHDAPGHFLPQGYLPRNMENSRFFEPTELGYEAKVSLRLKEWTRIRNSQA